MVIVIVGKAADVEPQLKQAGVAGVRSDPAPHRGHSGIADVPGGGEIRLAHAQRDDIIHADDQVEELADTRGRQGARLPAEVQAGIAHGDTARRWSSGASPRRMPSIL